MDGSIQRPDAENTLETNTLRVVRVPWLKFMAHTWKRITILNKLVIFIFIFLVILQTAVGIAALVVSSNSECDKPFRTYLIVYIARIVLSCPFHVAEHFRRAERRLLAQGRIAVEQRREEQLRLERQRRRQERLQQSGQSVSELPAPSHTSTVSVDTIIMQPIPNRFFSWGEKLKLLADVFSVAWFIVGNYILIMYYTACSHEIPMLYFTTMAFVFLGYFVAFLPLILYLSVFLCLPCVKRVLHDLNITDLEVLKKDNRKEEISRIPVFRYRPSEPSQPTPPVNNSNGNKPDFLSKFFKGYRNYNIGDVEDTAVYEEIVLPSEEDAVCCICLSDYESNDLICKLWCEHHFHRSCITDWFQGNRKCPLCKQDFRGMLYNHGNESDHDSDEEDLGESSRIRNTFQMAPMNR